MNFSFRMQHDVHNFLDGKWSFWSTEIDSKFAPCHDWTTWNKCFMQSSQLLSWSRNPLLLWNKNIYYFVYNSLPLDSIFEPGQSFQCTHKYPMFHDPLYDSFLMASNINFECLSHDYMSTICHLYITFINLITLIWSVLYKACTHLYSADHYQNQFALVVPKLQKFGLVSREYSSYSIFFPSLLYNLLLCLLCLRPFLAWVSSKMAVFFFFAWK